MVKQESCTKKQSHGRSATGGGGSTALPTWELATKDVHIELNDTKPLVKLLESCLGCRSDGPLLFLAGCFGKHQGTLHVTVKVRKTND